MPRTIAVECPGCPPVRALTFDVLGLVKVVEANANDKIPKVVERWGSPDSSCCILASSIANSNSDPLLGVARKNGLVEILNPLNGDVYVKAKVSETNAKGHVYQDNSIVGLHLFKTKRLEASTRSSTFLTCTMKGNASLRSVEIGDVPEANASRDSLIDWNVCGSGTILCSAVNYSEKYAVFGGKGNEVTLWELDTGNKIWTAKYPHSNTLGMYAPTWFTAATFLSQEDHRKFVTGTNHHQVRLYDVSAQRRPVISFDFRESPIKSVIGDFDGHTVYLGTGSGDLASFDMRTGKLLGCFIGKCCGSIRSIDRHPELPLIASCGLDSYLRFWDVKTRKLLSAVFLKQHLTGVVFDTSFSDQEPISTSVKQEPNIHDTINEELGVEDDPSTLKRRKSSKAGGTIKKSKKKRLDEED